jgi:hypothetical protein
MDYSKLISRSFELTKKYKFLWLLSFLTILGGVASEENLNFGYNFNFPQNYSSAPNLHWEQWSTKLLSALPIIIVIVTALILLGVLLFIVGLIAKGGLINSIIRLDKKLKVDFGSAMSTGKQFAWRLFLLRLLFGLVMVVFIIAAIPIVIILFFLFFLTIPALWLVATVLAILVQMSHIVLVNENLGVFASIAKAWKLLRQNWSKVGLMWLINLGLGLGIAIVFFLFALFCGAIIAIIVVLVLHFSAALAPAVIICLIPIILLLLVVMMIVCSIITTFLTSFWTLGVTKLTV